MVFSSKDAETAQNGRTFPPALPHGPIVEVFSDVFTVRGTARMAPLVSIARNMTIVRQGSDLTLFSTVRLSPRGEAELEKLGKVKHVVKLGFFHGADDPYYVDRYRPALWAHALAEHPGEITATFELRAGGELPLADASLFTFENAVKPECALLLRREGGILLTCDSVQNWADFDGCSFFGAQMLKAAGFLGRAKIGPGWRRVAEAKDGPSLKGDFERLLAMPFRHLLSAHGTPLRDTARDDLRVSVDRTYPKPKEVPGARPRRA